ncbi:DoxX family membrane protein [Galbibacter sp.]|uniref:DoxX family membrane protein n=1 Tax=Galbibacter sp. TaxID=2918471 RepID=UPI002C8637B3|nr:MauE/DoxX family redox-associated membrane protein [Galbibacter sp.]HLV61977.1 MauE/DoxX family redox-associated membrane protein [Galbibacter sp.]
MIKKVLMVVSALFGLMFVNAGLSKFYNYMPTPEDLPAELVKDMTAMAEIVWLTPLVGGAEILGGLLIIFPKTRALGALIILPVFIGIILTNALVAPSGLPLVLVLLAILIWIFISEKAKFKPLFMG